MCATLDALIKVYQADIDTYTAAGYDNQARNKRLDMAEATRDHKRHCVLCASELAMAKEGIRRLEP